MKVRRGPEGPGARSGSHGGPQGSPGAPKCPKTTFEAHAGTPLWEAIFGTFWIFRCFCGTLFLRVVLDRFRDRFKVDFGTILEGNFKDFWYNFRCTLHIAKPHCEVKIQRDVMHFSETLRIVILTNTPIKSPVFPCPRIINFNDFSMVLATC